MSAVRQEAMTLDMMKSKVKEMEDMKQKIPILTKTLEEYEKLVSELTQVKVDNDRFNDQ